MSEDFLPAVHTLATVWLRELIRPVVVSLVALVGVSGVLLAGQTVLRLVFVPAPSGLIMVVIGLLPEVTALMLPVALLFGTVAVARRWSEGGEFLALFTGARGARALVPVVFLTGLAGASVVAGITHHVGPWGRQQVRSALLETMQDLRLRPGQLTPVGTQWVRAEAVDGDRLEEVFLAWDDGVAIAPHGGIDADGSLVLEAGVARTLPGASGPEWSLRFDRARFLVAPDHLPTHPLEQSDRVLRASIERRLARGLPAHSEQLWLFKRTTLPLSVPLLTLLGLPLGVRTRRPALTTTAVVLVLWALQRAGDHLAVIWGPEIAAFFPLVLLGCAVGWAWSRWWHR